MISYANLITFSCFHKQWLFKDSHLYHRFIENLDTYRSCSNFHVYAYVIMPNHVHLISSLTSDKEGIAVLGRVKRAFSKEAIPYLQSHYPQVMELVLSDQKTSPIPRFWQVGRGYWKPLKDVDAFHAMAMYIHENPIRRRFVERAEEWQWSSAGYYLREKEGLIKMDQVVE